MEVSHPIVGQGRLQRVCLPLIRNYSHLSLDNGFANVVAELSILNQYPVEEAALNQKYLRK